MMVLLQCSTLSLIAQYIGWIRINIINIIQPSVMDFVGLLIHSINKRSWWSWYFKILWMFKIINKCIIKHSPGVLFSSISYSSIVPSDHEGIDLYHKGYKVFFKNIYIYISTMKIAKIVNRRIYNVYTN